MTPGSQDGIQVVVDDAEVARAHLAERGVETGDVQVLQWGSFTGFTDPDGNVWALQQLPPPGSYESSDEGSSRRARSDRPGGRQR